MQDGQHSRNACLLLGLQGSFGRINTYDIDTNDFTAGLLDLLTLTTRALNNWE
jgi:hypothetical protein